MDNLDWHERFVIQAKWTEQLRHFLYQQVGINDQSRILEVGCGTGVITSELKKYSQQSAIGIDIDFSRVEQAIQHDDHPVFSCADAYHLPFSSQSMDFVISHFLFLWLRKPVEALKEMLRVLKSGGKMVALAEPDHLARIDNPKELWTLGEMQTKALIDQGANPMMGRRLPEVFAATGIKDIQYGVSGFQTTANTIPEWFESEWKTLNCDLETMLTKKELSGFKEIDLKSRQDGSRVLWVPTFYAYGIKID